MIRLIRKINFTLFTNCILICAALFLCARLHHVSKKIAEMQRDESGFSLSNIECRFDHRKDWETPTADSQTEVINVITQQPFYWLAKGFQAYALISQDNEYVLKFFQQQRLRKKSFIDYPLSFIFSTKFKDKMTRAEAHKEELYSSSKLSFEEIPEETGIIYVHLNRTENVLRNIKLINPKGRVLKIKLDDTSFMIQRRADYIVPTLTKLAKEGKLDEAKQRLDQIFDLLLTLAKKGIVDGDTSLIRNNNMGLSATRAIYIDTGHLQKQKNLNVLDRMKYEFTVRLAPLHIWAKIIHPELASYFEKRKEEILASIPADLQAGEATTR